MTTSVAFDPQVPAQASDVFRPDALVRDPLNLVSDSVTITGGALLPRGAVLGQVTATGAFRLALASAVDGSDCPIAILANQTDATDSDVTAGIYLQGEFNAAALTLDPSISLAAAAMWLRLHLIFVKGAIADA